MVQRKPTPEEQLLKLIEGGSQNAAQAASEAKSPEISKRPASMKSSGVSLAKMPGFFEYLKDFFSKKQALPDFVSLLSLQRFNQILLALVIASAVYLVIDFIFFKPSPSHLLSQVSTSDAVYPSQEIAQEQGPDLSVYKAALERRHPFLPPQAQPLPQAADSGPQERSVGSGTLGEVLQGIKLVGISWSDQPLAMIEDVSSGRTHFIRQGQEIKGIKVQEIKQEKVTVTYEGQEGDLF